MLSFLIIENALIASRFPDHLHSPPLLTTIHVGCASLPTPPRAPHAFLLLPSPHTCAFHPSGLPTRPGLSVTLSLSHSSLPLQRFQWAGKHRLMM